MKSLLLRFLSPAWADVAMPAIGLLVLFFAVSYLRRVTFGRARALIHIFAAVLGAVLAVVLAGRVGAVLPQMGSDTPHARACDVMKIVISLSAAAFVFYEAHRLGQKRPVAERWQKLVLISLGVASIIVYFQAFRFGYPKFYHRWDQYHYYMGAKYFPEIGYDGLYKCTAIAQDDLGDGVVVKVDGKLRPFDFRKEVRKPEKKIRNLSGDNLLVKAADILEDPKQCTDRFTPERWEQYKADVAFFSSHCYLDNYWITMQHDHGYNPPPVWTLNGNLLANLHDPGVVFTIGGVDVLYAQILGGLDVVYILGAFALIFWAFGWRVFAVAAIFWGCQSSAPAYWTLGAMLRQDWFFFFVGAVCFARKRWFELAGASMVYAGLLRIFPGLAVIGWLILAGIHIVRHKRMKREHVRTLIGGTLAAAVLMGASLAVVGKDSYQKFYHHTIQVHDQTPLTNHMGLRVLVGHDVGTGKESGRMRYTKDVSMTDPFTTWKQMRLDRYQEYKPVAYGLIGVTFFASVLLLRRIKSLWIAQCLSQVWIILLSQLTCYYYTFMVIAAPLTRLRRDMEVWLFGFAAMSQFVWKIFGFNDDKYTLLTLLSLALSYAMMFSLAPREPARAAIQGPRSVLDLSGPRLAALVAIVPGAIMVVMAVVKRDVSSIGIGGAVLAAGLGLWNWANQQAKRADAPAAPAGKGS